MDKKVVDLYAEGYLDRIFHVLKRLRSEFFGLNYEIGTRISRKDKGHKALVHSYRLYAKFCSKESPEPEHVDLYSFLKEVVEAEIPLPFDLERCLFEVCSLKRDFSELTSHQKCEIRFQVVGAILWHEGESWHFPLHIMVSQLLDKESLFSFLVNKAPLNPRTASSYLSPVCPNPLLKPKGRPPAKEIPFIENRILVPNVFFEKNRRINFLKLKWAIVCIAQTLKGRGYSLQNIRDSAWVALYLNALRDSFSPICNFLIDDWILEGLSEKVQTNPS